MYQYKIEKVLKLKGNRLYAVLDLGFDIQVTKSFELCRVEEPELDFNSNISDPELSMRSFVIGWLKTAPRPLYVHMEKFNGGYEGEILDKNGRSEEHTSELQSRGLISYAVFCLKKKK